MIVSQGRVMSVFIGNYRKIQNNTLGGYDKRCLHPHRFGSLKNTITSEQRYHVIIALSAEAVRLDRHGPLLYYTGDSS
jgi:hypothetical protein